MNGVEVKEVSLDEHYRMVLSHDLVKKHFAAGIEYFDEEFGPAFALERPELLAAFVNAAAAESLAMAIADTKPPLTTSAH